MIEPTEYKPGVPPGETIKEMLESRGWSVSYLADSMSCPASVVRELIEGEREITREIAIALALSFGGHPASFWQNLERNYRDHG